RSGLVLPALSLGLWHNFGDDVAFCNQRDIVRRAFDLGITHFDLANNYGPPPGSAETNFGRLLREDLSPYRDELIISTKAGWAMHPGPYGGPGGSRKYLLASLDASLRRLGLDYVDIFYSHRPDATTPLEETIGALDTAVRSGRALYAGISSYSAADTARPHRSPATSAPRCSSTSRPIRWSTGGSRTTDCSRPPTTRASASSASPRWRRVCSRTSTWAESPRIRVPARALRHSETASSARTTSRASAASMTSRALAVSRWRRWRWPGRCATNAC